ncbi:MAG: biotin/lipoyl-binding protein [Lachnospiraceae bacterium]|nr:biotin/lipoyl-binding protein [Lachnospiraceae bacterium]
MKEYIITVNGKNYDVMVEERGGGSIVSTATTPQAAVPQAPSGDGGGSVSIEAGAAGKVFRVEAPVGTQVKKGQTVVVLEVMKMETPVVAPKDGVIVSIEVSEGQQVDAGALLATMD